MSLGQILVFADEENNVIPKILVKVAPQRSRILSASPT
jgi:hypothetical protein